MRGFNFTYETVRGWEARFAPMLSQHLKRRRRGHAGTSWYVDETYIKVDGYWQYLYRAIDRDGNLVDVRLSESRDLAAAEAFFEQAVATVGHKPERVTTDKHSAYPQAIQATLGFTVIHRVNQYLNNQIEQDHRALKQRYYPMRGFGSSASAARFCVAHEELRQYFHLSTPDKHLSPTLRRQRFQQHCSDLLSAWKAA